MHVLDNMKIRGTVKKQILLSAFSLSLCAGLSESARCSAYAMTADNNSKRSTIMEHTTISKHATISTRAPISERPTNPQASKTWRDHNKLACELWKSKLYSQAQAEAISACRLAPTEAIARTNLAAINQTLSLLPDAIRQYETALRIEPNNQRARTGLAQCLAIAGNRNASLRELAIAAKGPRSDQQLTVAIAQLYSKLGLPQLAIDTIRNGFKGLSDSHVDRQVQRLASECLLLSALKAKDVTLATQLFGPVLTNSPSDPQVYIESAKYLCNKGSTKEARQILAAAINDKGYCAQLFFDLAQIFESKAGLCLESADASDHEQRDAWLNLAEQCLKQSISANPSEAKYHVALASCLDMHNKISEAVTELTSVAPSKQDVIHFDKSDLAKPSNDLAANIKALLVNKTGSDQNCQSIYLRCVRFNIDNLSCGCRLNLLESQLRAKYGVVCVNVFHDGSHGVLLVYNPKKTTFKDSISRTLKGSEKTNILYETRISTIEQLSLVALAHTTASEPPLVASIVALPPQDL
ncbi:hypothetical protein BH10CYA1_BH10CYA1_18430 [soil metagenome]